MTHRLILSVILTCAAASAADVITLHLRTRVEPFKGSGDWREVHIHANLAGFPHGNRDL